MSSLKYFSVLFIGMLMGIAIWMPETTLLHAAGGDVPGDIFIEHSSESYCPNNIANNGTFWNTKIRINSKYIKKYRIGSVSISGAQKGILAMITRIDQN